MLNSLYNSLSLSLSLSLCVCVCVAMLLGLWRLILRLLIGLIFNLVSSFWIALVLVFYGTHIEHGFVSYWMWLYFTSLSFLSMISVYVALVGVPSFHLLATFNLVIQLTTGISSLFLFSFFPFLVSFFLFRSCFLFSFSP